MSEIKIDVVDALRVTGGISDAAAEVADIKANFEKGGSVSAAMDLAMEKAKQLTAAVKQYRELLQKDHDRVVTIIAELQGLDADVAQKLVGASEAVVSRVDSLRSFFGLDGDNAAADGGSHGGGGSSW